MAFSEGTKDEAYKRSGGRCECTRDHPGRPEAPHHGGRCPRTFSRSSGWEAHHITSVAARGTDALSNLEVLCTTCHQLTATYGV
jgi:5-methylcytosine-specific restriction endonuclease McrA